MHDHASYVYLTPLTPDRPFFNKSGAFWVSLIINPIIVNTNSNFLTPFYLVPLPKSCISLHGLHALLMQSLINFQHQGKIHY